MLTPCPINNTPTPPTARTPSSRRILRHRPRLVNEFAAHGYNVILSARSAEKMHTHAADLDRRFGITALVIPADLESPTGAAELHAEIKRCGITLTALVNNAGYGTFGLFQDAALDTQLAMMQLNVTSLVVLTKLFLPDLLATNGKILNLSSTAAFQPGPYMAVYYATKAFVLSFSEALAAELALTPSGTVPILRSLRSKRGLSPSASPGSRLSTLRSRPPVTVTALCPGPTASGFQDKAAMHHSAMVRGKRLPTAEEIARRGFRRLPAQPTRLYPRLEKLDPRPTPPLLPPTPRHHHRHLGHRPRGMNNVSPLPPRERLGEGALIFSLPLDIELTRPPLISLLMPPTPPPPPKYRTDLNERSASDRPYNFHTANLSAPFALGAPLMKLVVIGGTGLIGAKLVQNLRDAGHDVLAASRSTGVNTITGEGLEAALAGADVVIDVSNAPSWEDRAVMEFFETAGRNIHAAEASSGVGHHVALSVVGTEHLQASGYFRAKLAQENLIKNSGIPYTIVRATQFFEFVGGIADSATNGDTVRLPPALMQPIAAADVAAILTDIATSVCSFSSPSPLPSPQPPTPPINTTIDIAGPNPIRMDDLVRQYLTATSRSSPHTTPRSRSRSPLCNHRPHRHLLRHPRQRPKPRPHRPGPPRPNPLQRLADACNSSGSRLLTLNSQLSTHLLGSNRNRGNPN